MKKTNVLIPIARVAPPTTANIAARTASLPGTLWRSRVNADTLVAVVRPSDRDHLCSEHSLYQETAGKLGVGPELGAVTLNAQEVKRSRVPKRTGMRQPVAAARNQARASVGQVRRSERD